MKDTRKRTLSRVIRISSSVTIPIALCVMLYPELPLSLMQSEYIEAAQHLRLLALGALAAPLVYGYSNYVYSIGKYVHVLFLGIALNGSQLVLYGILIQFWQEIGIAFAYSLGFFIALSVIIPSALKTGYKVEWLNHLKLIAIPGPVTVIMFLLEPEWYIGIPVIVLVSMISYTRLQLVTKDDILEIAEAFLPQHSVRNLSDRIRPIIKIMYGK